MQWRSLLYICHRFFVMTISGDFICMCGFWLRWKTHVWIFYRSSDYGKTFTDESSKFPPGYKLHPFYHISPDKNIVSVLVYCMNIIYPWRIMIIAWLHTWIPSPSMCMLILLFRYWSPILEWFSLACKILSYSFQFWPLPMQNFTVTFAYMLYCRLSFLMMLNKEFTYLQMKVWLIQDVMSQLLKHCWWSILPKMAGWLGLILAMWVLYSAVCITCVCVISIQPINLSKN